MKNHNGTEHCRFIQFSVHFQGILANNTWIKVVDGQYRAEGPAKQYYPLAYSQVEWKSLVFRVLTNQGNKKYTCVYRVHLYEIVENSLIPFNNK